MVKKRFPLCCISLSFDKHSFQQLFHIFRPILLQLFSDLSYKHTPGTKKRCYRFILRETSVQCVRSLHTLSTCTHCLRAQTTLDLRWTTASSTNKQRGFMGDTGWQKEAVHLPELHQDIQTTPVHNILVLSCSRAAANCYLGMYLGMFMYLFMLKGFPALTSSCYW